VTFTLEQVQNAAGNCFLLGLLLGVGFVLLVQYLVDKAVDKRAAQEKGGEL
jgi:hypothetical protein